MKKYLYIAALTLFASCSDWTMPERESFGDHEDLHRNIPLIEAETEDDLHPELKERFAKIREYRKTPRVLGFGWFGNWTAKGSNPQNYLKMLPDSVDMVSLWGPRGNLSIEQQKDLKFFQEVKGGKAFLCWIISNLGDNLTPVGEDPIDFWQNQKGGGDFLEGVKAYANAICDTIDKYNLDGFDIDYEPDGGHAGNMANSDEISPEGNKNMQVFIETLSSRLRPKGKIIAMDGQPRKLSHETSKLVDYYIYQAYGVYTTTDPMMGIGALETVENNTEHLVDRERKAILTINGEKYWSTGGNPRYLSTTPEVNKLKFGKQLIDFAILDLTNGMRVGGVGIYHLEYDYNNQPEYRGIREALYYGNIAYPGKFE